MLLLAGGMTPVARADNVVQIPVSSVSSYNWSGYAVLPSSTMVQSVSASWVVPTINSSVTPGGWSCTWVGIDGYSSGSVEQVGIMANGSSAYPSLPQYFTWFEMYPDYMYYWPDMTVNPGDHMSAQVVYAGSNNYVLSIQDLTSQVSASTTQTSNGPMARSSGEWIVEAPTLGSTIQSLADFGSETFTGASATLDTGLSGSISALSAQAPYSAINLTPQDPTTLAATPSPLDSTGSSFSVTENVPEPSTLALAGGGALLGLIYCAKRLRGTGPFFGPPARPSQTT
jgi:hypothetical protein